MKRKPLLLILLLTIISGISKGQWVPEGPGQLRTNLYIVAPDGARVLMDGTLTQYDSSYSNNIDGKDARKMSNFSENWGMLRGNTVLVVERRHTMKAADSIFFKMWNMRIITYQIELIASGLEENGRTAVLIDHYLNTSTPVHLNDTTRVPFAVTKETGSRAQDRFSLIFSLPEPEPPLEFISTQVFTRYNEAALHWETTGKAEGVVFEIERSADGKQFSGVATVPADSARKMYQWTDRLPVQGAPSYYRIKATGTPGGDLLSETMKVHIEKVITGISLYPNPAKDHLKLTLIDQPKGRYDIKLLNSFGLTIYARSVDYTSGKQVESLQINQQLLKGIYHLEVKGPDGSRKVIPVLF